MHIVELLTIYIIHLSTFKYAKRKTCPCIRMFVHELPDPQHYLFSTMIISTLTPTGKCRLSTKNTTVYSTLPIPSTLVLRLSLSSVQYCSCAQAYAISKFPEHGNMMPDDLPAYSSKQIGHFSSKNGDYNIHGLNDQVNVDACVHLSLSTKTIYSKLKSVQFPLLSNFKATRKRRKKSVLLSNFKTTLRKVSITMASGINLSDWQEMRLD